eukprot:380580-Rhodomonas_salina.1
MSVVLLGLRGARYYKLLYECNAARTGSCYMGVMLLVLGGARIAGAKVCYAPRDVSGSLLCHAPTLVLRHVWY